MITLAPASPVKKSSPSRKALALVALLTLSGSALAGCGGSGDDGDASVSPSASASETTPAPSPSTESASAPASSPATGGGAAAGPVPCTADMLAGAVENVPGGAGADGISRVLVLTNVSADGTCTVAGYPGVSYLDAAGQQVGAPAARTEGAAAGPVTLAPGQAAAAELRETVAQKYGNCQVQETASLLVYPPEDTASLTVPYPSTGCTNADIELMQVGILQAR
ncbi:DUF4232 domain-containing protein [Arthrobacter sp. zg-Y1110]|uniref:DUF4232 domain-containing protein n=1 Tax=Arthrobacter sp. zg-Y1110 TaxID=2886932 RepID=UPI001D13FC3D|nr:DUF4232 domain-containing protein [Arthrobacter sp. zg-Y1110]MCC3292246.1 DUF4232 domain-containing protein [Arthrobacter sp. zg-Y1110]UWX85328.1 DUF4232 domain-containing protein [Arthrobacter sp. zg-Y1110]